MSGFLFNDLRRGPAGLGLLGELGSPSSQSGLGLSNRLVSRSPQSGLGLLSGLCHPSLLDAPGLPDGVAFRKPDTYTFTKWRFVGPRFNQLLENLKITIDQAGDGEVKYRGVVACLNRDYRNNSNLIDNGVLIGSWAKRTRVRPSRDIDIIFVLPWETHLQFQKRTGNIQSQILQEMRSVLRVSYPATDIRGDRQVVVIPFNTCKIEIAPAFHRSGGGYFVCDTNNGGRYKHCDPSAEIAALDRADRLSNGNVRKLTRILKQWQRHCNVPIKSFYIEALIKELLPTLSYGGNNEFWFDWLVRDAFEHMIRRANGYFLMPATNEKIFLGDEWLSRARSAYLHALYACEFERENKEELAGEEWQKIFGTMIHKTVS